MASPNRVQRACGTILNNEHLNIRQLYSFSLSYSPKTSTAVTDIKMATISFVILSRKIGMDSTAMALANRSVTRRRWCFFTIRIMRLAYFFSRGFPPLFNTSRLMMSSDSRPIVSPDISPVKNEHQLIINANERYK